MNLAAFTEYFPVLLVVLTFPTAATGHHERDQIEPDAGRWSTWVMASTADLRPPAPHPMDKVAGVNLGHSVAQVFINWANADGSQ